MAAFNDTTKVIKQIEKNNRGEYIQVGRVIKNNGEVSGVDIRTMFTKNNEILPTYKGVRLSSEIVPEVVYSLIKCMSSEELQELHDMFDTIEIEEQAVDIYGEDGADAVAEVLRELFNCEDTSEEEEEPEEEEEQEEEEEEQE